MQLPPATHRHPLSSTCVHGICMAVQRPIVDVHAGATFVQANIRPVEHTDHDRSTASRMGHSVCKDSGLTDTYIAVCNGHRSSALRHEGQAGQARMGAVPCSCPKWGFSRIQFFSMWSRSDEVLYMITLATLLRVTSQSMYSTRARSAPVSFAYTWG